MLRGKFHDQARTPNRCSIVDLFQGGLRGEAAGKFVNATLVESGSITDLVIFEDVEDARSRFRSLIFMYVIGDTAVRELSPATADNPVPSVR